MAKNDKYAKNLRRSAKVMAKEVARTAMPSLSETVISAQESFNDLKQFLFKNKSKFNLQKKLQERTLLTSVSEIINNAKSDIASGNLFNDRSESRSMSEFLDYGFDENDNEEPTEESNGPDMSSYRSFLASTSANSMASSKAVAENQLKSIEYLGEIEKSHHVQNLMINNKYHLEAMARLSNIETLAKSMVEFNVNTMQEHIKKTDVFYQNVLNGMSGMSSNIQRLADAIEGRYGKRGRSSYRENDMSSIYGGGSFDVGGYINVIKKNFNKKMPIDKSMLKAIGGQFKDAPLKTLMIMALPMMLSAGGLDKTTKKLDSGVQGMFAAFLRTMGNFKDGKFPKWMDKMPDFVKKLAQIGGDLATPDRKSSGKPDLSSYKNQALTLEMEQKKAKAITEVIPQYLSAITKKLTGKDMVFNYDSGTFVDAKEARREFDRNKNKYLANSMSDSRQYLNSVISNFSSSVGMDKVSEEVLENDLDALLAWAQTDGIKWKPKRYKNDKNGKAAQKDFEECKKKGLWLSGGYKSYRILSNFIMASPEAKRTLFEHERNYGNAISGATMSRLEEQLQSSGLSSVYNEFNDYSDKRLRKLNYEKTEKELMRASGRKNYFSSKEAEDEWLKSYKSKNSNDDDDKIDLSGLFGNTKLGNAMSSLKNKINKISSALTGKVTGIVNPLIDKIENISAEKYDGMNVDVYNEEDDYDYDYKQQQAELSKGSGTSKKKQLKSHGKIPKSAKIRSRLRSNINAQRSKSHDIVSTLLDFRPYFDTIDSHLNHSPKLNYSNVYQAVTFDNAPLLVKIVTDKITGGSSGGKNNETSPVIVPGGVAPIDISAAASNAKTIITDAAGKAKAVTVDAAGKVKVVSVNALNKAKTLSGKVVSGAKTLGSNLAEKAEPTISNIKAKTAPTVNNIKTKTVDAAKLAKETATNIVENRSSIFGSIKSAVGGFGKAAFRKGKSIAIGSMVSSMIGLGPIPGAVIGSLFGKKDKKAEREAKNAAKAVSDSNEENKKLKKPSLFKRGGNLALGAIASTMLTGTPIPGLLIAHMINKKKVKKYKEAKNAAKDVNDVISDSENENKNIPSTTSTNSPKRVITGAIGSLHKKDESLAKKNDKKIISDAQAYIKAERAGNTEQVNKIEDRTLQKAKATGDANAVEKFSTIVSNYRDQNGSGGSGKSSEEIKNPKGEGLFSKIGKLFSGGGGILKTVLGLAAAYFGIKNLTSGEYLDAGGNVNKGNVYGGIGAVAGKVLGLPIGITGYATKTYGEMKDGDTGEALGSATYLGKNIFNKVKNTKIGKKYISKAALKVTEKVVGKHPGIAKNIAKLLKKLANSAFVKKVAPNLAKKLATSSHSMGRWIGKAIGTAKNKALKGSAKVAANQAIDLTGPVGIAINIGFAVIGFMNGWFNVKNILRTSSDYDAPTSLKFTSGIVSALDASLGNGWLDLLGIRDDIIKFVYKFFASDKDANALDEAQKKQKSSYQEFLQNNAGTELTEEKYNNLTNKKWYKKLWDGTKSAFGGHVESLDDYKTGVTVNNIDNSQTTNVVAGGDAGSGGRGPSLANKSNTEILRNVRDRINRSIGGKSTKLSNKDIENYTNRAGISDGKTKSNNFLSNIGNTIKGAASWVVNGVVNGFNWLKNKFTGGSGGRGVDESNYYNQGDSRWANQSFGIYNGKRDTVKAGGCGPTVAAMALQQLTGHRVSPKDMANLALNTGTKYDNGGTDPSFFNAAANMYGIDSYSENGLGANAIRNLKTGTPVPIMGKGGAFGPGTHYLLANKLRGNGNVEILDPQNRNNNRVYNINSLRKNTSASTVFSAAGTRSAIGRGRNNKYVKYLKSITGRGATQWMAIVKSVKAAIAEQNPGYSQSNWIDITINDKTIKCRTDCSGFVGTCLKFAGIGNDSDNWTSESFNTSNNAKLTNAGFTHHSFTSWDDLIEGDILAYNGHVDIFAYNEGNSHYKYNAGGTSSINSPNATVSNKQPTHVWRASDTVGSKGIDTSDIVISYNGKTTSGTSSTSSSSGGSENWLTKIISGIKINNPVNNVLGSLLAGHTKSSSSGSTISGDSSSGGNTTSSSSIAAGTNTTERQKNVITVFKNAGLNKSAIAALMGNIQGENSGFDPNQTGDGGKALGLAQWHPNRRPDSVDWSNEASQAEYMLSEIQNGYPKLWKSLQNATPETINDIVRQLVYDYEGPADKAGATSSRQKYAQNYYNSGLSSLNYSGSGGRGKSINIPSYARPSAYKYGRGMDISKNSPIGIKPSTITISKNSLVPSKSIAVENIGNSYVSAKSATNKNTGTNAVDSRIISIMSQMVELLMDIKNTNQDIADKKYPVSVLPTGTNGNNYQVQQQKSSIYDSIIAGL